MYKIKPVEIFIVKRKVKVNGRIKYLIISIKFKSGINHKGLDLGEKWEIKEILSKVKEENKNLKKKTREKKKAIQNWLETLIVYGNKPYSFKKRRKAKPEL